MTVFTRRPRLTYLIDPRFPGGTSSALAAELRVMHKLAEIEVRAIKTRMFRDRPTAPVLAETLAALNLPMQDAQAQVSGDIVVIHNPSMFKFDEELDLMIAARHLIVVTHENFERPGGAEGFDVDHCLSLIAKNSLALQKSLAPISQLNRESVARWAGDNAIWTLLDADWFNICDFPLIAPTSTPRDRRGRLSRPGFEKFPAPEVLDRCFPSHSEANVILGADSLTTLGRDHPHWTLLPFQSKDVAAFFEMIDFMVYFTSPNWSESFGRVIAEAIAAGKLVLTDARVAQNFPGATLACAPEDVSGHIAHFCANPDAYRAQVLQAQEVLSRFAPDAFARQIAPVLDQVAA